MRGLQRGIRAAKTELTRYAQESYQANLDADASPVERAVDRARRSIRDFARETYEATLGADATEVRTDVGAAERIGTRFARQAFDASVGVRGTAEAAAELKVVERQAQQLDRQDVNIDVDADSGGVRSLSESFRGLSSNIRATGTVLAAAAIPFAIAGIGAGAPAILALTASVGGLASALSSGLVGAAVAATGAMGALGGALALVAAPVSMLIGTLKEYDQSLASSQASQDAAEAASRSYTDAKRTEAQAESDVTRIRREGQRAIEDQERALRRVRAEGTSQIQAEERALAEVRREGVQDTTEQERQLESVRRDATRAIQAQEDRLAETRRGVAEANAAAEGALQDARESLTSATRSLSAAQNELNRAERDEPLIQRQATLDLASARDRASDAARDAAAAINEYGRHSEEATDALREQKQAELDLEITRREVNRTRNQGSEQLRGAREAARAARDEERGAAEDVEDQERNLIAVRAEGRRQIVSERDLLIQTRADEARAIAEQSRVVRETRAQAARDEAEQLRAIVEARKEANQQEADAERALAETRRQSSQQNTQAQATLAAAVLATKRAAEALKDSQKALREETEKLTPAQKALYNEYQRFGNRADKAFAPAQDAAARLGVEILRLAESYLPRLGAASTRVMGAVRDVFETFRTELGRPVEQAGITRYLNSLPGITRDAGNAAVRLGLALFNVFTRSLPYAKELTSALSNLAGEFLAWTRSAEGQNSIDRFFGTSINNALRLKNVIADLAGGIVNVFQSINQAGLSEQALGGLERFADGFREITEEGTQTRRNLDRFMESSRRLMPFVGQAVGSLAREFGILAQRAIGARQEGSRLTILEQIFRGIGRAAKPLRQLVLGTFRDLGPEIALLIPEIARLANVFAGSNGPLVAFVRTIRRALEFFNDLPGPIKRVASNLLTLRLILGGLGITALLRPLGRFAGTLFAVKTATRGLGGPAALGGVAGAIGGIGRVLVGAGVIAAVAALAAGLVIAYKKSDTFRRKVNNLASDLQSWGKNKFRQAKAAFLDIFDLDEQKVRRLGRTASQRFVEANTSTIRAAARRQSREGSAGDEFGTKLGYAISGALNRWARGDGALAPRGLGKKITQLMNSGSNPVAFATDFGRKFRKTLLNETDWGDVGKRIRDEIGKTLDDAEPLGRDFGVKARKGILKNIRWGEVGRSIASSIAGGFVAFALAKKFIEKLRESAANTKDAKKGFTGIGIDAAAGFVDGFTAYEIAKGLVSKIKDALEFIRRDNRGHSPWGSTEILGRDAGEGFWKGWEATFSGSRIRHMSRKLSDGIVNLGEVPKAVWEKLLKQGWKGRAGDSAERLYAPDSRRWNSMLSRNRGRPGYVQAEDGSWVPRSFYGGALSDGRVNLGEVPRRKWSALMRNGWMGDPTDSAERIYSPRQRFAREHGRWATRPGSAGGRAVTAQEMEAIQRRTNKAHARDVARLMQAGMKDAPHLREFAAALDSSMGGYLGFRNGMGTEPQ